MQIAMANILETILGDMLAPPFDLDATELPSPEALKKRIICRGKSASVTGHHEQGSEPPTPKKQTISKVQQMRFLRSVHNEAMSPRCDGLFCRLRFTGIGTAPSQWPQEMKTREVTMRIQLL